MLVVGSGAYAEPHKEEHMKVKRVYYNDNEILIAGHLIEDVLEHPVFYPFERRRYECQEITDESLIIDYNSESYRKFYKEHYPAGTRIVLFGMKNEPHPLPRGVRGTVKHVCDDPMVHVTFDNGRYLGLIPDVDQFAKLKDG